MGGRPGGVEDAAAAAGAPVSQREWDTAAAAIAWARQTKPKGTRMYLYRLANGAHTCLARLSTEAGVTLLGEVLL